MVICKNGCGSLWILWVSFASSALIFKYLLNKSRQKAKDNALDQISVDTLLTDNCKPQTNLTTLICFYGIGMTGMVVCEDLYTCIFNLLINVI